MKKLLVAFGLLGAVGSATAGCTASYETVAPGWYVPGYYEANGYPVTVVAPGIRAYYINGAWWSYHPGYRSWRPYGGQVVYRGRVYAPRVRVIVR